MDADGVRIVLAAESINVYNVTAAASLGTLVSDASGVIVEGSFSASDGDEVEFSHATYPLTIRTILKSTQARAYTDVDTHMSAYIVENLASRATADAADIYAVDLDNPSLPPFKIASGKAGETVEATYQTNVTQRLRLYPVSITEDTKSYSRASLDPGNSQDVTVQATDLFTLFNFAFRGQISDSTDEIANDGAGRYYNYLMPAGTFGDGESLMLIYTWTSFGVLATREHKPTFGDIQMGGLSTSDEGYGVTQILLQRHGSSIWATPSFLSDMVGSDDVGIEPVEITTIDPDTEDIEIKYVGTYTGGFGEFYVLSGVGYKIPAPATSTVVYLTEDGTGEILFADGGLEALTEG
jgi:hypothetical protein